MKMLKKCLIGLFAGAVALSVGFAGKGSDGAAGEHQSRYYMLQVGQKEAGKVIGFKVRIPDNFKQILEPGQEEDSRLMEFMPKTDKDPFKWSELLTLSFLPNSKIDAIYLVDSLKKRFKEFDKNAKVWHYSTTKDHGNEASIVMTYMSPQGRKEMIYARYCSGPLHCSGVQYAVVIKNPNDEGAEEKAWNKISDFVNDPDNLDLYKFDVGTLSDEKN